MAEELADIQNTENAAALAETPVQPGEVVIGKSDPPVRGKPAEPPKKLSIREHLNKAVEQVRKDETGRLHKSDGKFASKNSPGESREDGKSSVVTEHSAGIETPKPTKDAQPEAPKAFRPPPGWSAESKAFFDALPSEHPLRKDVEKRESEVSTGFKKYSDNDKRYQAIEQVLTTARPVYQSAGVQSDAEAIQKLFAWEAKIRANPGQAIAELARSYNINLNAQPSEPSNALDIPPALKPVLDQFGQVSQQVKTLEGEIQRQNEERVNRDLQSFAKDKPHFEQVRVMMGQLMQGGVVPPNDLEGAYQKAIAIHPEVSAAIAAEKETARLAEQVKHNAARVANATRAAVSPGQRAPAAPLVNGNSQAKGVRGSIMKAIGELSEERA